MKNVFILLSILLLLGTVAALPTHAQSTVEVLQKCILVKDVEIRTDLVLLKKSAAAPASTGLVGPTDLTGLTKTGGTALTPDDITEVKKKWGIICLVNTVNNVVNWLFIVLVVVAVAMIAIAGFLWMIGGAEPEKQKLAGRMILGAVVGIIIAFLAQVIPNVVTGILL